jgi:hypothetical protein
MPTVLVDHTGTSPNALRAPHDQGSADASATSNMSNASSYTFVEAGSFQDVSDAGSIDHLDERETAQQVRNSAASRQPDHVNCNLIVLS